MSDRKRILRVLELLLLALVVAALIFLYVSISGEVFGILRMGEEGRFREAKEYLRGLGIRGVIVTFALQILQTLVGFVPPEILQVAVSVAYPFYVAIPLMLAGALIGASLIFLFVRQLHWRLSMLERKTDRVHRVEGRMNHKNSTMAAMCLWFVMPLVPFGAVAYYGANKEITYRRYILTCTIGMLPSILFSHFLGGFIYNALGALDGNTIVWLSVMLAIVLSIVREPSTVAASRSRMFRRPICFRSSNKMLVSKPTPSSSILTQ